MKSILKRTVTALYWEFCYEDDAYLERLAVCYFKPDTGDDVVLAELETAFSKQNQRVHRVHRYSFGKGKR